MIISSSRWSRCQLTQLESALIEQMWELEELLISPEDHLSAHTTRPSCTNQRSHKCFECDICRRCFVDLETICTIVRKKLTNKIFDYYILIQKRILLRIGDIVWTGEIVDWNRIEQFTSLDQHRIVLHASQGISSIYLWKSEQVVSLIIPEILVGELLYSLFNNFNSVFLDSQERNSFCFQIFSWW